jgi:hypothetical protein
MRQVPGDRWRHATGARRQMPGDRCQFNSVSIQFNSISISIQFNSISIQFNSVSFSSVQFTEINDTLTITGLSFASSQSGPIRISPIHLFGPDGPDQSGRISDQGDLPSPPLVQEPDLAVFATQFQLKHDVGSILNIDGWWRRGWARHEVGKGIGLGRGR